MNHQQSGSIRTDLIGLLIGAALLGGLLVYGSVSGQELPLWPALLVIAVNIWAAFHVFTGVKKRKQQAKLSDSSNTGAAS